MLKIWFDMDGVLDNFDKLASTIQQDRGPNIQSKLLTNNDKEKRHQFWLTIENTFPDFWLKLEEIENIHILTDYLLSKENVCLGIISSPPTTSISESYKKQIVEYKKQWINTHFPNTFKNIIISTEQKWKFKKTDSDILIDDRDINVKTWIEHNGKGIIFKTPTQTLEDLKKFLGEN